MNLPTMSIARANGIFGIGLSLFLGIDSSGSVISYEGSVRAIYYQGDESVRLEKAARFEVKQDDCLWRIHVTPEPTQSQPLPESDYLAAYWNGTELFLVDSYKMVLQERKRLEAARAESDEPERYRQPGAPTSQPKEEFAAESMAAILTSQAPMGRAFEFVNTVWLSLLSDCYLERTDHTISGLLFSGGQVGWRASRYNRGEHETQMLTAAIDSGRAGTIVLTYHDTEPTKPDIGVHIRSRPPAFSYPYNEGFTNVIVEIASRTNLMDRQLIDRARVLVFKPRPNGKDKDDLELEIEYIVSVTSLMVSDSTEIPPVELPPQSTVGDNRFPELGGAYFYLSESDPWLTKEQVQKSARYQSILDKLDRLQDSRTRGGRVSAYFIIVLAVFAIFPFAFAIKYRSAIRKPTK
jgi:hypothetical protein